MADVLRQHDHDKSYKGRQLNWDSFTSSEAESVIMEGRMVGCTQTLSWKVAERSTPCSAGSQKKKKLGLA